MRLCDALAGQKEQVTIIYPYTYMKDNIRKKDIAPYYGLEHKVDTRMLPTPLREHSGKWFRSFTMLLGFTFSTLRISLGNIFKREQLVFISRDAKSLLPALILRKVLGSLVAWKVFFMAAEMKDSRIYKFVIRESDGILAGVSTTREAIRKIVPIAEEKFLLALAPVPVYRNDPDKAEARRRINYSLGMPLVVYTGKLGLEIHEVIYILEVAKILPDYRFLFTGGRKSVVESIQKYCHDKSIENVILTGFFEDSRKIRDYQIAADVLVSYYTSKDHMIEFNYPQKINEYMSTLNPVVTPDFPATRDVLNERNVFFVEPDDTSSLAEGIEKLVTDKALSRRIAEQAFQDVKMLSFENRAVEFIRFIKRFIR
jgi:glycosyltransferase involved in cell wall biosynthesis